MKINSSISGFAPLFRGPEYLFKGLSGTGIDGIELGLGFKSRWSPAYYKSLSKKYGLPIVSMHQPLWACLGLYFDEGCFDVAQKLDVKHVVCHPLPKISFQNKLMRDYLRRLSDIQKKTGIEVLIENLPDGYDNRILRYFFPPDKQTGDIMTLYEAVSEYDLKIALDIDHLQSPAPHKEAWFEKVLPKIGNIHLSSFDAKKRHMPLYLGDFHAAEFIAYLEKVHYKGLLTFEINYPGAITLFGFDFGATKKSVEEITAAR